VLGILAEGSIVRILPEDDQAGGGELVHAIGGASCSVADGPGVDLAREAQLGSDVDRAEAQAALDAALEAADPGAEDSAAVRYLRAQLRAAGEPGLTRAGSELGAAALELGASDLAALLALAVAAAAGIAIRRILLERAAGPSSAGCAAVPSRAGGLASLPTSPPSCAGMTPSACC